MPDRPSVTPKTRRYHLDYDRTNNHVRVMCTQCAVAGRFDRIGPVLNWMEAHTTEAHAGAGPDA